MNVKLWTIATVMIGALALTGCQTADLSNQKIKTINMPIVSISLDSDGDGVADELDLCPGTPYNMVVDPNGCPASLLPDENSFKMEARAFYNENSSEIKSQYYEELNRLGERMQQRSEAISIIDGHISKREDHTTNQTLSKERVEGVKNYLILKYKIAPNRIKTFYYGSERPIAPDDNAEGSDLNQRVYIMISNAEYDVERFKKIENDDK
ncbi:OOP family OmpA-OmpF porin [Psychrobacter sp. PL19]|uniref:OmpA family protein n=1 Tax=Psychrobacter sp. PL19 TaxID=2760711 RepID=UPI001AEAFE31